MGKIGMTKLMLGLFLSIGMLYAQADGPGGQPAAQHRGDGRQDAVGAGHHDVQGRRVLPVADRHEAQEFVSDGIGGFQDGADTIHE
mgnify:CR=1 FL=1